LYWTDRHESPQEMDWELAPLSARQKQRLVASKQWVADKLKEYNDALLKLRQELPPALEEALGVFRHGMQSMLDFVTGRPSFRSILGGDGAAIMTGPDAVERLQVGLIEFLTRMARCVHSDGAAELPQFDIRLPWSEQQEKRLLRMADEMVQSGLLAGRDWAAAHAAMVWMFAQEFAPYYGTSNPDPALGSRLDRTGISDTDRALRALGSLLAWLPIYGGLGLRRQEAPLALTTLVRSKNAVLTVSLKVVRSAPPQKDIPPTPPPLVS